MKHLLTLYVGASDQNQAAESEAVPVSLERQFDFLLCNLSVV